MKAILVFLPLMTFVACSLTATSVAQDVNIEPVKQWIGKQAGMKTAVVRFTQERKLRSLRKPIKKSGTFWFQQPSTFRWQVGDPAETIAVQKSKEDLFVVNKKDKTIDRYPYAVVAAKGSRNGLTFLEAGFPKDLAEFQKNFKIRSVKESQGYHEILTQLTDRRASLGCRKIVFFLDLKSYELKHVHLYFRDGSIITNRFDSVKLNSPIPKGTFEVDTQGFTVETKKG